MFTPNGGTLPPGLNLSAGGAISGIPTQSGNFSFGVKVTDSGGCLGTQNFTLNVICPTITLAALPGGTAGTAYSVSNLASGGSAPYNLSLSGGALPPGVVISGNGLTGTPTQAGAFDFTLLATDASGCANSRSYTVTVVCPTITLTPASLPPATLNTAYPQTVSASPAGGNYSFAVTSGALPSGLTLNSNGSFSGAPTLSGTFNFRITATGWGAVPRSAITA